MALSEAVERRIESIRNNRTSGAAELTAEAAEALVVAAGEGRPALEEAARAVAAAQPAMVSLVNLGRFVTAADDARAAAYEFVRRMRDAALRVSEHAARLIHGGDDVLTHSYSSAALGAFLAAHKAGVRFRVVCTESRPLCEGAAMAKRLAAEGIESTLIVDAAAASALRNAALVLVGADAVSARAVVNKTGTALIVLAAAALSVPVYALCGSEKVLPPDYELPPEPAKDPREILTEPVPGVTVVNFYFESAPLEYFAGIVTEEGIRLSRG